MLTPSYGDFGRVYAFMNELRRCAEPPWEAADTDESGYVAADGWPRFNVYDAGKLVMLTTDLPGLSESELQLTITQDTLQLSGERRTATPDGYAVQRRERTACKFSRSILLPWKVDADRATASVKDGVLTIALTKAPEAQPRQIRVQAS